MTYRYSPDGLTPISRDESVCRRERDVEDELVAEGFAARNRHGIVRVRWARAEPITRSGEYVAVSEDGRYAGVMLWLTDDGGNVISGWRQL